METPKEMLLGSLRELFSEDFKMFKWYLHQGDILNQNGFSAIPKSKLENADKLDVVDLMDQTYDANIIKVATMVLVKMKRNDLVKTHFKKTSEPTEPSAESGAAAGPSAVHDDMRPGQLIQKLHNQSFDVNWSKDGGHPDPGPSGLMMASAGPEDLPWRLDNLKVDDGGQDGLNTDLNWYPDLSENPPEPDPVPLLLLPPCVLPSDLYLTPDSPKLDHKNLSKADVKKYYHKLTLDPDTVPPTVTLSDCNREAIHVVLPGQDSYSCRCKVVCLPALTDRCYWEFQRRGEVEMDVVCRGFARKRNSIERWLNIVDEFWSLRCSDDNYGVSHNAIPMLGPCKWSFCDRVAVFLDCPAGALSFYEVSEDRLNHIFTHNGCFREPKAEFWLYSGSSVSLCDV
ncbi:uncharacterized protein LOC115427121 [Sphaeramia orbicularis]|uniref:uncharacterized protein LOC115427121 n=1 Tax=Sphaeramia orbicularis TaxID=375764 RepID=UPI00117F815C|nr:uncharacterized protein LOC115427121 [Sphaeramia orbicularis]XP_030001388.1 uncharacterized protein LOC115427121 [Sphaeramia orbicularis]